MTGTMKEAHIHADTSVTIHDVPIPEITDPNQILIKVHAVGCNPKDWKMQAGILKTISDCPNSGDDVAGIVHAVGSGVTEFRVGDRVAGMHELGTSGGAYAEYALTYSFTTFHLGKDVSFEEAAAIPMPAYMAALGLFGMLQITGGPYAAIPAGIKRPLVIYGAASSVGAYAVKMAKLVNMNPIIGVAGHGLSLVQSLIGENDAVVDYRAGDDAVVKGIRDALQGEKLEYAFDAVSEKGSYVNLSKVMADGARISLVLPHHAKEVPPQFETSITMAGSLWRDLSADKTRDNATLGKMSFPGNGRDFALVMSRMFGRWLEDGRLKAQPHEVIDGGLEGVEVALKNLRCGKNSGLKYVIRVPDTPGL